MTQMISPKTVIVDRKLRIPGKWGAVIAIATLFVVIFLLHREPNKSFHPLEDACEKIGLNIIETDDKATFPDTCASIVGPAKRLRAA